MYSTKKQTFLQGAAILSCSVISVKILGALFKIPLIGIVGENGMGYYNTAFSIYAVFYSLATAGFPTAISKLVSENYAKGRYENIVKIRKMAFPIFLFLGLISTFTMLIVAKPYTQYIGNELAYIPIIALSPSIFFCCLISVYKGYYQGLSNMYPTAFAELIEAAVKLVLGLAFSYACLNYLKSEYQISYTVLGKSLVENEANLYIYSLSASAALLGVSFGSFFAFLFFVFYNKLNKNKLIAENNNKAQSCKLLFKRLWKTAVPVGIGAVSISFCMLIDASVLQRQLSSLVQKFPNELLEIYINFLPSENAENISSIPNFLYGCYSFALTLFMLVPSLTQALAISALPSLANVWVTGNKKTISVNIEAILRITCLVAIPAGLGLTAVARPIVYVLNGGGGSSEITARILMLLGVSAVFSAVSIPINAMLQAIGKEKIAVINLIIALSLKITLSYFLSLVVSINILAACISTFCCYFYVCIANLIVLVKSSSIKIDLYSAVYKTLIASIISILITFAMSFYMMSANVDMKINLLCSVLAAVISYIILILCTKTLKESDFKMLPNSEKIIKKLKKYNWIE